MELLLEMAPCFEHLQNKQKPHQEGIHVAEVNPLAGAGKLERYRKVISRAKIILGRPGFRVLLINSWQRDLEDLLAVL